MERAPHPTIVGGSRGPHSSEALREGLRERCHSVTNSSFQVPLSGVPGDTLGDPLGDPLRDPKTSQKLSMMFPLFLLPRETSPTQKPSHTHTYIYVL